MYKKEKAKSRPLTSTENDNTLFTLISPFLKIVCL